MYDKSTIISECEQYRYELRRIWQPKIGVVCFIMLNPSTADGNVDDPTIRRYMGFAASWGYGGIVVGNLFAYRATHPKALGCTKDPIGPDNDKALKRITKEAVIIVCAWGDKGRFLNRDKAVLATLEKPKCLGINRSGTPKHPLYVKSYKEPVAYRIEGKEHG